MRPNQQTNQAVVASHTYWIIQCVCIIVLLVSSAVASAQEQPSLSELKGAFILNFIKFARFPASSSDLTVCVHQSPQVADFLRKNSPKSIQERTVIIKESTTSTDSSSCNVAYVPMGKISISRGLLLITDEGGGGVIELLLRDDKLVFGISSVNATQAAISFPSQVMSLAVQLGSISRFNVNSKALVNYEQSNASDFDNNTRLDAAGNWDVYSLPRLG